MTMKAKAEVDAGICGHHTAIDAETDDGRAVSLAFETTCDNIGRLRDLMASGGAVDAYAEIDPRREGIVLSRAREARSCSDCVVPAAALKAMRVAAGLALVADVAIHLEKAE